MIFNRFSAFQSSLKEYIQTVTERVYRIEASTLVGTKTMTSIPEQRILVRKIEELDTDRITDRLHIDGFVSCINSGADELQVGKVIIRSPQDLKAHLVATNSEGLDFGGFVCP